MDWNGAMEEDRQVLKRIVALLFSFASLAECASTRHYLLRASVLWVLRFAEAIAQDFVMDTALENGASLTPAVLDLPALGGGDSSADAMRLAQCFRALAVLLRHFAAANPVCSKTRIADVCLKLAACAAIGDLVAGASYGRSHLCLAPPDFAVEHCDSS
jgi:hypothetical protein